MALKPLNSVGGFSVGEIPATVILPNADITANKGTFTGNLLISNLNASWGILTDNLYYSNGVPWDLQEAAGSNTQVQFNNNNNFGASANFTYNDSTQLLTVAGNAQFNNANLGNLATANYINVASNLVTSNLTVNNTLSGNVANFSGNLTTLNANLGNLATANYINVANNLDVVGNVDANNISVDNQLVGNTANFSGNVVVPNLTVNLALSGNTANFSGNITALNADLGNLVTANYANLANDLNANGNVSANNANIGNGNIDLYANGEISASTANFTGNVYAATFVGNISGGVNITAPNTTILFSNSGLIEGSNNFTFNYANNYLFANGTANITGNTSVGGILTDNYYYANGSPVDFQQPAGSNTQIQFNDDDDFGASANLTFNFATQTLGVVGLVDVTGNVDVSNTINGNIANFSGNLTSLNANLGNLATANYVNVANDLNGNIANFSGNLTAANGNLGNLVTANYINVASNLVTSNLTVNLELAGNTANFTGNISALNANLGNLATANYVNVSQQINGNIANFSGNLTAANAALGNLVTANYVNVANDLNVVGNVNAGNLVGPLANGTSNVRIFQDANIEFSSNGVSNVVTITDNALLVAGNIQATTGNISANGNVTANGYLLSANANVTGTATIGILKTDTIDAVTSTITMSAGANGSIELVPNGTGTVDVSNFRITQVADPVDPRDAANKEYVDALAGEGLTIHTPVRVAASTNLVATYTGGGVTHTATDIALNSQISFSVAHGLSINDMIIFDNTFNGITGGEAYFVASVVDATTITIKNTYGGVTITTLTNGTGLTQNAVSNPGVGATLTNAGANAAIVIDSVTLSTNDRVLVFGQTNGFENGVYIVSDIGSVSSAWVLTRSSDMDTYAPASPNAMTKGDYVFVEEGATQAGASYVLTSPSGEIIIGTDDVVFTEFSKAGSYTAGNGISIVGTLISANVDGITTDIVGGNIIVKAGANLTTPNLGDATFSSLTWNTLSNGNVTANNLSIGNIANIGLDLTVGGNIQANGTISANANVSGLNLTTNGNVQASGNVLANNVTANTLLTVPTANVSNIVNAGNVTVTNELSGNTANFSGNVIVPNLTVNLELAGNTANFSSNVVVNNLTTNLELAGNTANFSGNVIVSNLSVNLELAGNTANFTSTLVAGNLTTAGLANVANLNVTANVTSDLLPNANITHDLGSSTQRWDYVYGANLDLSGSATIAGNLSANNFTANILTANNKVVVGNTAIEWGTVTTASVTANQTIAQAPYSGVTGVDFIVKGLDAVGGKYSVAHVTAVTDGTNVDYTTYGTIYLNSTTGTLSVNIVGSNIELQVTPSSSNSTVWTTQYRLI
jgi:hypothetical protein